MCVCVYTWLLLIGWLSGCCFKIITAADNVIYKKAGYLCEFFMVLMVLCS